MNDSATDCATVTLVTAPAGYGKTTLLRELLKRFEEQNWLCAHVSFQEARSLAGVAHMLASEFGAHPPNEQDARQLGLALGESILRLMVDRPKSHVVGVVLLIDDVDGEHGIESSNMVDALFFDFLPGTQEALRRSDLIAQKPNRFRVVAASRHVPKAITIRSSLPWQIVSLRPIDLPVIQEIVNWCLPELDQQTSTHFAAHLKYYTAGHLGNLSRIMGLYQEAPIHPDEFFYSYTEEIWKDILLPSMDAIRGEVDSALLPVVDSSSIFRYLDYGVLRELIQQGLMIWQESEVDLADRLTDSHLISRRGRFLRDDQMRPLLALRLQKTDADRFTHLCRVAREICLRRLRALSTQLPEVWLLESFYQYLQQYGPLIQNRKERIEIRTKFFGEEVPSSLELFLSQRNEQAEREALNRALADDSELRFVVNYYLREDFFNDKPFQTLRGHIAGFSQRASKTQGIFAFVIMPFAEEYGDLYENVVKRVVEDKGVSCRRADDFYHPSRIMDDVRESISKARFLIADLSGANPNVLYEVGLAHAIGQTVILLAQSIEDVPADLRELRVIRYDDSPTGARELESALSHLIDDLQRENYRSRPVYTEQAYSVDPECCLTLVPPADSDLEVYEQIVKKTAERQGLHCEHTQSISSTKRTFDTIWERLNQARVVVADLSGRDPEVSYLVGISHGLGKDVILLTRSQKDIPFDLRGPSHIIYSTETYSQVRKARQQFAQVLRNVLN